MLVEPAAFHQPRADRLKVLRRHSLIEVDALDGTVRNFNEAFDIGVVFIRPPEGW